MLTVYTAIFGGYDDLRPVKPVPGARFVAFTDRHVATSGWEIITPVLTEDCPRRESRKYKTLAHKWFPHSEWTIYLDGNLRLKCDPRKLLGGDAPLRAFPHYERDTWYQEAEYCARIKIDDTAAIRSRVARYDCPPDLRLLWGGLLIRQAGCEAFNELWWAEIQRGTQRDRDQISLPYCLWKTGTAVDVIEHPIPFGGHVSEYVERVGHQGSRKP